MGVLPANEDDGFMVGVVFTKLVGSEMVATGDRGGVAWLDDTVSLVGSVE